MSDRLNADAGDLADAFRRALTDCEALYRRAAEDAASRRPDRLPLPVDEFIELMVDLHRGLAIKIFVDVGQSDSRWSQAEIDLAQDLFEHVWGQRIDPDNLRAALKHIVHKASDLNWGGLCNPFVEFDYLAQNFNALEDIVIRLAEAVAGADGPLSAIEVDRINWIKREVRRHLLPLDFDDGSETPAAASANSGLAAPMGDGSKDFANQTLGANGRIAIVNSPGLAEKSRQERLDEALAELDALIGLEGIKAEVRELVNFLRIEDQRALLGLPRTQISLHLVFLGNPGTGKTTVARLIGKLYGALGVLKSGHLVETDRSGLVASYTGQTGPRTNKKIDEALDGVLFIDEAYSLVSDESDDAFGLEAIQTLLKRMEDDRGRLVVVLAGYTREMENLLRSNPGLSSRFNRRLLFPDNTSVELGRIFQSLSDKQHYRLPSATRLKLLLGFDYLVAHRDRHFGNGRMARNVFEQSIRRLASRLVSKTNLTRDLLSTIEPEDLVIDGTPDEAFAVDSNALRLIVNCPGCAKPARFVAEYLGKEVRCKRCDRKFVAEWGLVERART